MEKAVSLAEQIFAKLEKDIYSGVYKRGELLTETKLCEELGVSRTPVREAIRVLEQEHLVTVSNKGIRVISITPEEADYIFEIRRRVEGLAASACAKNISDEEIKELGDIIGLQEFYAAKHDGEKVTDYDSQFHQSVYKFSGSVVIYDTLTNLHKKIQKYRKRSESNKSRAAAATAEHRRIYEAIAARDPEAAEKAMIDHVCSAHAHFQTHMNTEE